MNNQLIYVGGYASPEMEGIQLYNLDLTTGQLTYVKGVKGVENPSFLIVTKDLQRLYAVIEVAEYQGISGGGVVGFEISEEGRNLVSLNNQPTNGRPPLSPELVYFRRRIVRCELFGWKCQCLSSFEGWKPLSAK